TAANHKKRKRKRGRSSADVSFQEVRDWAQYDSEQRRYSQRNQDLAPVVEQRDGDDKADQPLKYGAGLLLVRRNVGFAARVTLVHLKTHRENANRASSTRVFGLTRRRKKIFRDSRSR